MWGYKLHLLPLNKNHMQSLLIFFSFPLHYAFFSAKAFSVCFKQALANCWLQPIEPQLWVHGEWSSQEPAKWGQCTPVQLQACDARVIAVDLEEAMPEKRTGSLPGLELQTVMERARIVSYFLLMLFETGSCIMV